MAAFEGLCVDVNAPNIEVERAGIFRTLSGRRQGKRASECSGGRDRAAQVEEKTRFDGIKVFYFWKVVECRGEG
jgi:hypothetical protein